MLVYSYIYIDMLVLVCEIQECSMSYRQSEMYKLPPEDSF